MEKRPPAASGLRSEARLGRLIDARLGVSQCTPPFSQHPCPFRCCPRANARKKDKGFGMSAYERQTRKGHRNSPHRDRPTAPRDSVISTPPPPPPSLSPRLFSLSLPLFIYLTGGGEITSPRATAARDASGKGGALLCEITRGRDDRLNRTE